MDKKRLIPIIGTSAIGLLMIGMGLYISTQLSNEPSPTPTPIINPNGTTTTPPPPTPPPSFAPEDTAAGGGGGCPWTITKPSAQLDMSNPWQAYLIIDKTVNTKFNITVFQCPSGWEGCNDVSPNAIATLSGAGFNPASDKFTITGNVKTGIPVRDLGKITLRGYTPGKEGVAGCDKTSIIIVTACPFSATKARIQVNSSTPWTQELVINKTTDPSVRVAAFQCLHSQSPECDKVGVDARVTLNGAGFSGQVYKITGPGSIPTVPLRQTGTITVTAVVPGKENQPGCSGTAKITVSETVQTQSAPILPQTGIKEDLSKIISGIFILLLGGILYFKYYRNGGKHS